VKQRRAYPSDLTEAQWEAVVSAMPPRKNNAGRPRTYPLRGIWNAIFYQGRVGCQWSYLPHYFPPWEDVWEHFCRWRDEWVLEKVQEALREEVRVKAGREKEPSAAIIDSQTVKTTHKRGVFAATMAERS
jgi:putative transposase